MPKFIQTTDRLLSDPELLKQHQMDIKVVDKDVQEECSNEEMKENTTDDQAKIIQMVCL